MDRKALKKWIYEMITPPDRDYVIFKLENYYDRDLNQMELDRIDRALDEINNSILIHRGIFKRRG